MSSYFYKIKRKLGQELWQIQHGKKPKIFGIGNNKTGTTSLKITMKDLGFRIGDQRKAERMLQNYAVRDFKPLTKYCKSAEFFQDFPFSKPFTYIALDQAFPNSKFILTVRDSPEQWYNSLTKFHAKLWGKEGRIPTKEDLMEATYLYKGRPWESNRVLGITPEDDLYNKELLIQSYLDHNKQVADYFKHRSKDLLILNVAEPEAFQKLCEFLDIETDKKNFPWVNKTADLKSKN